MVPVDVKHCERRINGCRGHAGAVCENRGGRPGLPAPSNPHGLCGRKATLNSNSTRVTYIHWYRHASETDEQHVYYGLSIIVRGRKQVRSLLSSQRHRKLFSVIADVVFVVRQIKLGNVTR